jgi:hypothetical protein
MPKPRGGRGRPAQRRPKPCAGWVLDPRVPPSEIPATPSTWTEVETSSRTGGSFAPSPDQICISNCAPSGPQGEESKGGRKGQKGGGVPSVWVWTHKECQNIKSIGTVPYHATLEHAVGWAVD